MPISKELLFLENTLRLARGATSVKYMTSVKRAYRQVLGGEIDSKPKQSYMSIQYMSTCVANYKSGKPVPQDSCFQRACSQLFFVFPLLLTLWGPHIEWLTFILSKQRLVWSCWNHSNTNWNDSDCMVLLITLKLWCHRPGVPKLSLAMYPFSISIHEHVPLNMGAGFGFFPGKGQ